MHEAEGIDRLVEDVCGDGVEQAFVAGTESSDLDGRHRSLHHFFVKSSQNFDVYVNPVVSNRLKKLRSK